MRARAIAEERERRRRARAPAVARVGRWLVCHASCLRDADGAIGDTALVIEPAQAAEIAPIITQAYELSPREQQITRADRARRRHRRDRRAAAPLGAHRARLRQGDLREGRRLQPRRARGEAVRRALRAAPPGPSRVERVGAGHAMTGAALDPGRGFLPSLGIKLARVAERPYRSRALEPEPIHVTSRNSDPGQDPTTPSRSACRSSSAISGPVRPSIARNAAIASIRALLGVRLARPWARAEERSSSPDSDASG